MDPLATTDELAARLRKQLTGDDLVWAELVLDSVSALIRSQRGWNEASIPATARVVTLEVAARVYGNPDAASSYSVTTGPYGRTVTFANPAAVGMYLSAQDKAALGLRTGTGLRTLSTTRGDMVGITGYVPVAGSPNPFPWYGDDVELP